MVPFTQVLLFFTFSLVSVNIASYTPCQMCLTRASPDLLSKISLRFYPNETITEFTEVLVENSVDFLEKMNNSMPTVVYLSGWTEPTESTSVKAIVGAYTKRRDHNVLLVNYYHIANEMYFYAALSVNGIAYTLAKAFNEFVECGLNPSTLHIVGHSLGGQIALHIGSYVNFTVNRITALDPAGPFFDQFGGKLTFDKVRFVDVIHTDAGYYGSTNTNIGLVHFHPNAGSRPQPGCSPIRIPFSDDDFCDHHKSYEFYAESVTNEDAFVGLVCDCYSSFQQGLCSSNETVAMGIGTPITARGNVYLQTNDASPYGRGKEGVIYGESRSSTTSILSTVNPFSYGRESHEN